MWIISLPFILNIKTNPSCLLPSNLWIFIEFNENIKNFASESASIEQWVKQSKAKKKFKTKLSHISWINGGGKEISYRVPQVDSWLWWRSHCHNLPRHSHHINFQSLPYMSHHGYTPSLVWDPHCPEYLKNKWLAIVLILNTHNEAENTFSILGTRGNDFNIVLQITVFVKVFLKQLILRSIAEKSNRYPLFST